MGDLMAAAAMEHSGPWTFDDLEQLPDNGWRYEVVDGALLMTPPPTDFHQAVGRRLFLQLVRQSPPEWEPVYEVAFRVRTDGRVPDLAVLPSGMQVRPRQVAYQASDFALLVEVVSPSTRGMDRVLKPAEYAAAGVPFYWRVETEPLVELVAYALVDGGYVERVRVSEGAAAVPGPFEVVIDVDALSQP